MQMWHGQLADAGRGGIGGGNGGRRQINLHNCSCLAVGGEEGENQAWADWRFGSRT